MLTENDVVDAVAKHLQKSGWHIERTSSTNERGHDILATKAGAALAVEAKGETSSDLDSSRFGKPFDSSQKRSHVAVALYKAACVFSAERYRPGIALPSTDRHLTLIEEIRPALEVLDVAIFLVDAQRGRFLNADRRHAPGRGVFLAITSEAESGRYALSGAAKARANSALRHSNASRSARSLSRRIRSRMYSLTFS